MVFLAVLQEIAVNLDSWLAFMPVAWLGFVCATIAFKAARWKREKERRGVRGWRHYGGWTPLGNALLQLQILTRPSVEFVIEEKLDEGADDDEDGGPDDPVAHLHRQAARIRRGTLKGPLRVHVGRRR